MRKYVGLKILRSIYFAIFDSYLAYCCLVWAQNCSTIQQIIVLQKQAITIINFQPRNFHTSPLFKQNSIIKFQDKICLENILFEHSQKLCDILKLSTFSGFFLKNEITFGQKAEWTWNSSCHYSYYSAVSIFF